MLTRLLRRLDLQTLVTATTGLMIYGLGIVTGPVLAHNLGAAGRGDLSAVQVPSQLFGFLLCFGLPDAAVFYAARHSPRMSVGVSWAFAVGVGGSVVAGLWWLVPDYLSGHPHTTIVWLRIMLLCMIVFVPTTVAVNLLRMRRKMTAYNAMTALPYVLNAVFIVVLAALGRLDLDGALVASFFSQVIWYAIVIAGCRGWPARITRSVVAREVHYGARLAIGSLSEMVVNRLDQFLLVGVISPRELGLYAVSASASGLSGPAAWGVAVVLFPRIRNARSEEESTQAFHQALRWTAVCSSSFAILLGATSPFLLPLLFGSQFRASVVPMLILLPGQVVFDIANVTSQKVMANDRPGEVSKAYLVAAIITVVGLVLLIKPLGIDGAALVTSVSQLFYCLFLVHIARTKGPRGASLDPDPEAEPEPALHIAWTGDLPPVDPAANEEGTA